MIVLGLVLVILALGLLLAMLLGGANDRADYVLGGLELEVSTMAVFLLGALTLLVFVVGLSLIRSGTRQAAKRRKDRKELDRLNAKLDERERRDTGTGAEEPTRSSPPDKPEDPQPRS
jgi:uncharacterized membrane protein